MIKKILKYFLKTKLDRAIDEANAMHERTKYKYYVLKFGEKLKVVAKKDFKSAIKKGIWRRAFKGMTLNEIESRFVCYKTI